MESESRPVEIEEPIEFPEDVLEGDADERDADEVAPIEADEPTAGDVPEGDIVADEQEPPEVGFFHASVWVRFGDGGGSQEYTRKVEAVDARDALDEVAALAAAKFGDGAEITTAWVRELA